MRFKRPRPLSLLPAVLLAVLCAAYLAIARRNFDKPNIRTLTFEDMINSAASFPQSPNSVLPNGQTDQPAPPHTIPHDKKVLRYLEALRLGPTAFDKMKDPFQRTYASLARGRFIFQTFCMPCHGQFGTGDGPVAKAFPPFQFSAAVAAEDLSEGQIFGIVTFGKSPMPSYADQIAPDDRWKVALYIKDLARYQKQKAAIEEAQEEAAEKKAAAAAPKTAPQGGTKGSDNSGW